MLLDGKKLIETQLRIAEPTVFEVGDGRKTQLMPVRQIPRLAAADSTVSLDGTWQVQRWPFSADEAALAGCQVDDTAWEGVVQPGKVFYADPEAERNGKQDPNWNRVTLAHIDENDGAVLRRRMVIPDNWAGKRIILRFDSIFPAGRVYLNGGLLGDHMSAMTPVEYDVTDKVVPGQESLVAVRLMRRHKFVKMDMVRHACEFAGLSQSACFFAVEPCRMDSYYLVPSLDEKLTTGALAGTVTLANAGPQNGKARVALSLLDKTGQCVAQASAQAELAAGARADRELSLTVANPALWNDEYPNLYTVKLELTFPGQASQLISYRTGFRRFDLSLDGPRLNGNPVKFHGVNHLTFHPEHGIHTPREWLRHNLQLMKKANVNCIRTHYLSPRDLVDICDELGIYLLQELPIDWGTDYITDVEWVGPAMMRLMGGVLRDRHHVALMVWSVGNENLPGKAVEAEDGWNHMRTYDAFTKVLDPSRPNMFPPPGPANAIKGIFELNVGDIADTHYSFKLTKDFLKTGRCVQPRSWEADMEEMNVEKAIKRGWRGVWFASEWGSFNMIPDLLNNPYNSVIDDCPEDPLSGKNSLQAFQDRLEREWGLMRGEKTCLGGGYFPWICAGAGAGPEGNPWGWVRWGEDADWGPVTADLLPKPFFWAIRKAYSPVYFPERYTWKTGDTALTFDLENQFNAIDLSQCIIRTQFGSGKWMAMQRTFEDIPMACPPGETRSVSIPVWNQNVRNAFDKGNYGICRIALLDPKGFRVIAHDILVIPEKLGGKDATAMPLGPDAEL